MTDTPFTPIVFMKEGCPFCLKVRIFLLEAGLLDTVEIREFSPDTDGERAIRAELAPRFETVGFPTVKFGPEEYVTDSDAIVARFAKAANADPAGMPTYRAYVDGTMKRSMALYRENIELKKRLA